MTRLHRRNTGMTLIEIMIAVAILAMVTTLVYGSFAQTAKTRQRIHEQSDRLHSIHQTLNRMASDLSMAYVSVHLNPSDSLQGMRTIFKGTDRGRSDRLDFTAFSHRRFFRGAHESDQEEVSYFIGQDPLHGDRKVLARREQRRVDSKPQHGGNVQVLLEDVIGLDIKYLDPMSGEWLSNWDTVQAASQPNRMPSQVKITLVVPGIKSREPFLTFGTRAMIRMPYALNHAFTVR